jgi:oligopeptide/dipeptide ABC transporter ATP-binding protein
VAGACARVAVMYAGRVLESGTVEDVFRQPLHPYTEALCRALPRPGARGADLYSIPGQPPRLNQPLTGCPFAPRCPVATEICGEPVALVETAAGRWTACVRRQRGEL